MAFDYAGAKAAGYSDEEIRAFIAANPEKPPAPKPLEAPQELSFVERMAAKVPSGLANNRLVTALRSATMGAADPVVGAVQLGANALPDSTGIPQAVNSAVRDKESALASERGPDAGFDFARMAGNIASPVNLFAASRLPMASTALGRAAQGGGLGLAGGLTAPVENAEGGFWGQKAVQGGIGLASGALLAPVAGKIADFVTQRVNIGRLDPAKAAAETDRILRAAVEETGQRLDDLPRIHVDQLRTQVADALANGKKLDAAALIRKVDFDAEGIQPTLGQLTRDPMQFARERDLRGVAGVGEPLSAVMAQGNQRVSQGIGQAGQGASESLQAGEKLAAALRGYDEKQRGAVTAAYRAARESAGKDLDVPLQGLAQDYAAVLDAFEDKIPKGVVNQFAKLGLDPKNPTNQQKTFTIEDADKLLKVINDNWDAGPSGQATRTALGRLKDAVTSAVESVDASGGPFAPAVKAAAGRFKELREVPALDAATKGAQGDRFVSQFVVNGKAREVEKLAALLRKESPEAFEEARAQVGQHLVRAAFGENPTGDKLFRPESYAKALRQTGSAKLGAFFTPDEVAQLQRLGRIGAYQNSTPSVGAVNYSNTGSAVANLLSKGGGAALEMVPGGRYVRAAGAMVKGAADNASDVERALAAQVPATSAGELSDAQRRLIAKILSGTAGGVGLGLSTGLVGQ